MQNMTRWCECDNLMRDITLYDGKNMDLANWLLQIKKVAVLTNTQEYVLATAKSTSIPHKMLTRMGNDLSWQEIKKKLEEVYSPIAIEVHTASDLHRKQWPDKTLQEYVQNFTDLTKKDVGADPANIMNKVIIFQFFKNTFTTMTSQNA